MGFAISGDWRVDCCVGVVVMVVARVGERMVA